MKQIQSHLENLFFRFRLLFCRSMTCALSVFRKMNFLSGDMRAKKVTTTIQRHSIAGGRKMKTLLIKFFCWCWKCQRKKKMFCKLYLITFNRIKYFKKKIVWINWIAHSHTSHTVSVYSSNFKNNNLKEAHIKRKSRKVIDWCFFSLSPLSFIFCSMLYGI
jgi:hypothetical protein